MIRVGMYDVLMPLMCGGDHAILDELRHAKYDATALQYSRTHKGNVYRTYCLGRAYNTKNDWADDVSFIDRLGYRI